MTKNMYVQENSIRAGCHLPSSILYIEDIPERLFDALVKYEVLPYNTHEE